MIPQADMHSIKVRFPKCYAKVKNFKSHKELKNWWKDRGQKSNYYSIALGEIEKTL